MEDQFKDTSYTDILDIKINKKRDLEQDYTKIVRKDWWWLYFWITVNYIKEVITDSSESRTKEREIHLLTEELNKTSTLIWNSENILERKLNEIHVDVLQFMLEQYTEYIVSGDKSEFEYYPEYTDKQFNKKIYEKREFYENRILKSNKRDTVRINNGFKKSPTQRFIKNFISDNTPYSSVLIWHGVGAGKTCAAISIAENFRDFVYLNDQKILILTPSDTLQQNWRDEIFNIEKEESNTTNKSVQCTSHRYNNELGDFDNKTHKQKTMQVNRLINKYYEFMGYQKLASSIDKHFKSFENWVKPNMIEKKKIKYIRERFSNRVIIMDEVHVTRVSGNTDLKRVPPYLELIARYAVNTKVILATATPMYNVTQEIVWLLNLLLWNDKRSPIEDSHIFNADGITVKDHFESSIKTSWNITSEEQNSPDNSLVNTLDFVDHLNKKYASPVDYLIEKSKGYISYLRGDDPFTFPIRLYPSLSYTPNPLFYIDKCRWKELSKDKRIVQNHLSLYKNILSNWQYTFIKIYTPDIEDLPILDDNEENIDILDDKCSLLQISKGKSSFDRQPLQASNIVFPSYENSIKDDKSIDNQPVGIVGSNAFEQTFPKSNNGSKYTYQSSNGIDLGDINKTGKSFLHIDNIGQYSIKFKNILKNIFSSKGIVFVYSQFISHGIKPLAIALEENGFDRYTGNGIVSNLMDKTIDKKDKYCSLHKKHFRDLDSDERKNFIQAKYIYIDGDVRKKDLDLMVKESRGQGYNLKGEIIPNLNGEHIHVILGSKVVEQGISFFNVREIHILDPWHHLNMMEQAIGRGTRQFSHQLLEREKQNVTIFLHCATLPLDNYTRRETIDERVYRRAYVKKINMSKVARLLKQSAVDCELNRYGNIFIKANLDPDTIKMYNSKNISMDIKLYDEDYSVKCDFDKCNYECSLMGDIGKDIVINSDTYSEEFAKDDIEQAKEYIKLLFINDFSYNLDYIVNALQSSFNIDNDYVYIALNEIVNNRENVYDMYNRKGHIIYRDGLYIYQPNEIDNDNMPLLYRRTPLSIKRRTINLNNTDSLTRINKIQSNQKVFRINKKTDNKNSPKVLNLIIENINLSKIKAYINKEYKEYPQERGGCRTNSEPTIMDLEKMYLFSKLDQLSIDHKEILLISILKPYIENGDKTDNELHIMVLEYFSKTFENDNSNIIINTSDRYNIPSSTYTTSEKTPRFIRLINPGKNYKFLEYIDGEYISNSHSLSDEEKYELRMTPTSFLNNKASIYGFLKYWKGVLTFNVINNIGYTDEHNKDGKLRMKKIRTGARCGHATNVTKISEIVDTINNVLEFKKYEYSKPRGIRTITLCEELELILRYKQHILRDADIIPDADGRSITWFYKSEEIYLLDN